MSLGLPFLLILAQAGGLAQDSAPSRLALLIGIDRYDAHDLLLALSILGLNILDAWYTLDYLDRGGTEANPIASRWLKMALTPPEHSS